MAGPVEMAALFRSSPGARADLEIVAAENFGETYALTLRLWRRRFLKKWP
jgi:cyclopropane fatty-acyl-phospholipid synthase-like methyltransferase